MSLATASTIAAPRMPIILPLPGVFPSEVTMLVMDLTLDTWATVDLTLPNQGPASPTASDTVTEASTEKEPKLEKQDAKEYNKSNELHKTCKYHTQT